MTFDLSSWKKKIAACLASAMAIGLLSFVAAPAPVALAKANPIGAAITLGVGMAQINAAKKQIRHYDGEGRGELLAQLKQEYGVCDDVELNGRVDNIMANMTQAIAAVDPSINEKPYNYFVNSNESFNAFCTLGHNMSINKGLLLALPSDDEVAVVVGHEMGHGQKNHSIKGYEKKANTQVLLSAAGQMAGGSIAAQIVTALAGNAISHQGITKPQEWEADNMAFEYIIHSNYNPGACAAVWQRSIDKYGDNQKNSLSRLLAGGSDHPSDSARRDNYVKKLTEYSGGHVTVEKGLVKVNGKDFTTPAASGAMSSAERSYFLAGNLAAAYHNGQNKSSVTFSGGTLKMGAQPIMTIISGDEDSNTLAERLQAIK